MKRALMVVAVSMMLAAPVWAARLPVHDAAESSEYGRKFGGMIGRGVVNGLTGFVDILTNLVNETRQGPPLVGTLVGVGKGVGCGVLRTLSGVVDLTTFWVPGFNGMPVSDSYDNCMAAPGEETVRVHRVHEEISSGEAMSGEASTSMTEPAMQAPAESSAAPATTQDASPRYTK